MNAKGFNQWGTSDGATITQVLSARSNVFLISYNQKNILVDTGPRFMRRWLDKRLTALDVHTIHYLILTHSHFDHAANAKYIREKYGTKVLIHKSEVPFLTSGDNEIPQGTNFFTHALTRSMGKFVARWVKYDPCPADIVVEERFDMLPLGLNGYIIPTPGHSTGSMSVVVDNEIALVGDAMFGVFNGSVFPPFAEDVNRMLASWKLLLDTKCHTFLPSHGSARSRDLLQKCYDRKKSF